jgi:peptidoglycan hydrolase-like protein with peptidoglycan-binding domain
VSSADVSRMQAIGARLISAGVEVLWLPGWENRGAAWTRTPIGITVHHDASTTKAGEWGSLGVIRDGRSDVPPPLSQFQVGRGLDGRPRVAVVAAGRANHAGKGGPMWSIPRDSANSWMLGTEVANSGTGEPYTAANLSARLALVRAAAAVCGFAVPHVVGHKEWAPGRKSDPVYDMAGFRSQVGGTGPIPAAHPVLRQGSTGDVVRMVQAFLRRVFPSYAGGLVLDGDFGPATGAAVREFQRRTGLGADGVIGPATWAKLESYGYR